MNQPSAAVSRDWSAIETLARAAVAASGPCRVAVVCPDDPAMMTAIEQAATAGLIAPTLIGDAMSLGRARDMVSTGFRVDTVTVPDWRNAVTVAAERVRHGGDKFLAKGKLLTSDFLGELFAPSTGFVLKSKLISHIAVLKPERYDKLLLVSDGGVTVQPTLEMKLSILQNMIAVSRLIGVPNPRIAAVAAVEVVYPQMPVTTDAAILAKMSDRGQIKGGIVDGPLSFDVAVNPEAAEAKGVTRSDVAGQADALLAPNIETGNGIYKAMALFGRCRMGGVIVGGRAPIAIGSRSDTAEGKYNSLLLGLLAAR